MFYDSMTTLMVCSGRSGDILFTSRYQDLCRLGKVMAVSCLPIEEAVELLLQHRDVDPEAESRRKEAEKIVERLGRLPLAIDQAAAYMQDRPSLVTNLADFLPIYEEKRKQILEHVPEEEWEYADEKMGMEARNNAVCAFTTWEMTFQHFCSRSHGNLDAVTEFLTMSAFLAPTIIDEWLFVNFALSLDVQDSLREDETSSAWAEFFIESNAVGSLPADDPNNVNCPYMDASAIEKFSRYKKDLGWSTDRFSDFIRRACKLSLLQNEPSISKPDFTSFSLHPLIRDWLQLRPELSQRQILVHKSIKLLTGSLEQFENLRPALAAKKALLLHMDATVGCDREVSEPASQLGACEGTCADARQFAWFYMDEGEYEAGFELWSLVQHTSLLNLGEEHRQTLMDEREVALTLRHLGKYIEAERRYRKVLEHLQKAVDDDHVDIAETKGELAVVLMDRKRYSEAKQLQQDALQCFTSQLGSRDRATLDGMHNLALTLAKQGDLKEAEAMQRAIIGVYQDLYGAEHEHTLTARHNLAWNLSDQGRLVDAEVLLRDILEIEERSASADHPRTLNTKIVLAQVLSKLGHLEEAEIIHRSVISIMEKRWGKEHRKTLHSRYWLAWNLSLQKRKEEAILIMRDVLQLQRHVLGDDDLDTLWTTHNLASALSNQFDLAEVQLLAKGALDRLERILGSEHPRTVSSRELLAFICFKRGCELSQGEQFSDAYAQLGDAIDQYERLPGNEQVDAKLHRCENERAYVLFNLAERLLEELQNVQAKFLLETALGSN